MTTFRRPCTLALLLLLLLAWATTAAILLAGRAPQQQRLLRQVRLAGSWRAACHAESALSGTADYVFMGLDL
jgi:hypothetical protein